VTLAEVAKSPGQALKVDIVGIHFQGIEGSSLPGGGVVEVHGAFHVEPAGSALHAHEAKVEIDVLRAMPVLREMGLYRLEPLGWKVLEEVEILIGQPLLVLDLEEVERVAEEITASVEVIPHDLGENLFRHRPAFGQHLEELLGTSVVLAAQSKASRPPLGLDTQAVEELFAELSRTRAE
jgi:hypothetical protein